MAALLGIVLQFGVLIYVGLATYHIRLLKEEQPVADYAFPCLASGTVLLVVGTFLCGHVIEGATLEKHHYPASETEARIIWLQRAGTVNDQAFKPFAVFPRNSLALITTSHRAGRAGIPDNEMDIPVVPSMGMMIQNWVISTAGVLLSLVSPESAVALATTSRQARMGRRRDSEPDKAVPDMDTEFQEWITTAGVLLSVVGYVVQFVGIRAMHWSASVAQLGAIIIMAALRAWLRRNLAQSPTACPLVPEYELDWLATTLGRHPQAPLLLPPKGESSDLSWKVVALQHVERIGGLKNHDSGSRGGPGAECCDCSVNTHRVMMLRRDIGEIAGWHGPASEEAISLALAIEKAMDYFFVRPGSAGHSTSSESFENSTPLFEGFIWSLEALWPGHKDRESIHFHITRHEGSWKAYADELEAALSLWLYSVGWRENNEQKATRGGSLTSRGASTDPKTPRDAWLRKGTPTKPCLQLLGPRTARLYQNLQWWMPDRAATVVEVEKVVPEEVTELRTTVEAHRMVGFISDVEPFAPFDNNTVQYQQRSPPSLDHLYGLEYHDRDYSGDSDEDSETNSVEGSDDEPDEDSAEGSGENSDENADEDSDEGSDGSSDEESSDHSDKYSNGDDLGSSNKSRSDGIPRHERRFLAIESSKPLRSLYAQHLFSAFVWAAAGAMGPVEDEADVRPSQGGSEDPIVLHNTRLSKMAQEVESTRLGTLEEVYAAIIPPLSFNKKLPRTDNIIQWSRERASKHEFLGHWKEVSQEYLWLFRRTQTLQQKDLITKATALLMELLKAVIDTTQIIESRQFGHLEVGDIEELKGVTADLCDGLKDANADTVGRLLGLYDRQGRTWDNPPIGKLIALKEEDATVHFTNPLNSSYDYGWYDVGKLTNPRTKDVFDWTPLHHAAANPTLQFLRTLLISRVDVNARDIRGKTPLHYACQHNDPSVVLELIRGGADIEIQDAARMTPMHHAAIHGHADTVQVLLDAGADPGVTDGMGNTPLLWGAYKGHDTVVKCLWGASRRELRDRNGRTPLHLAVTADVGNTLKGSEPVVKLLLEAGMSTESKDQGGATTLHYAAREGNEAVVRLLLERRADTLAKDRWKKGTPLHYAAERGHEAVAKLLLGSKADANAEDEELQRPLHYAAIRGHEAVAELLLEKGAVVNANDELGRTALLKAAEYGQEGVMRLLLEKGAVMTADVDERTPLHVAASEGYKAVVKLLLEKGAVMTEDEWGRTPLHFATIGGHKAVVKLLLEKGAVMTTDQKGRTPLHVAAIEGHKAIVKLLLEKGAVMTADGEGRTPLDLAEHFCEDAIVNLLLENGAAITKDGTGRTPLDEDWQQELGPGGTQI